MYQLSNPGYCQLGTCTTQLSSVSTLLLVFLPKQVYRSSYCRKFVKRCWQLHARSLKPPTESTWCCTRRAQIFEKAHVAKITTHHGSCLGLPYVLVFLRNFTPTATGKYKPHLYGVWREILTVKNFDRGHGSKYSIHWSRHPLIHAVQSMQRQASTNTRARYH